MGYSASNHTNGIHLYNHNGSGWGSSLLFENDGWGTNWVQGIQAENDNGGSGAVKGKLTFLSTDASTNITAMTIYGRNVGIGSANPTSLLHAYTSTAAAVVATFQNGSGTCTFAPTAGATSFSCSSDERLKENIVDADNALGWIKDFRVRDYTIKADQSRMTGVIAQEVNSTHPEMVHL